MILFDNKSVTKKFRDAFYRYAMISGNEIITKRIIKQ